MSTQCRTTANLVVQYVEGSVLLQGKHHTVRTSAPRGVLLKALHTVRQSLVRSENTSAHLALRSPQNVDIFRVAVQRSPSKLTRRAARQLEISRRSVQRILNSHMLLFPSKITVVRTQPQSGKEQRLRIATWATCEEYTLQKTSFSDEDNLDEINKKRKIRFWAMEYPRQIKEKDNYGKKKSFCLVCPWHNQNIRQNGYLRLTSGYAMQQLHASSF
jgi:hypothetical protein